VTIILSNARLIVVNLVAVALIVGMFYIAKSPFESIVISTLLLIWAAVSDSYKSLSQVQSKKWNLDSVRFIRIAEALKLDVQLEKEVLEEDKNARESSQVATGIDAAFSLAFWLIPLANLIYTVASQFA
jgi:hypothetical protein